MPGMSALSIDEALRTKADFVELKIDGSRITWDGERMISDRQCIRNDRFPHVAEELARLDWKVRGEIAIPGGNVLQLNRRDNWHKAKFYIFELIEAAGRNVEGLSQTQRRGMLEQVFTKFGICFEHIVLPKKFGSFKEGWNYVKKHKAEGLVLKTGRTQMLKVKLLIEEKLPIIGHEPGKSKGAFFIDREGVTGKVSGTSDAFLKAYRTLVDAGEQAFAEIEYQFLTDDGKPFQPRLRRLGTLEYLKVT